jgi:acyl carrier protein
MTSSTIDSLKRIIATIKSDPDLPRTLSDTADLIDEVGMDSLQMLQFMLEIESSLQIQIDFDRLDYDYLRSLQVLAEFLDSMPARAAS